MQQTRLSRRWLVKIAIFLVAAAALGLWGLFDATMAYPARGEAHAEYMEYQYLMAMGQAGLPVLPVSDPVAELAQLKENHANLEMMRAQAEAQGQELQMNRAAAGLLKEMWLESLKLVGDLDAEHTALTDPNARFVTLNTKWQAKDQPKPLSGFDIPMQWGFVVIGFGLSAYLLLLVVTVGSKKHRYDADAKQLTFPDGTKVTPSEIEDIDKRKWDKFIVQVKAGGKWRKLDLLRYEPLEEWFLEMEKETSFYEPPEEDPEDAADDLDSDEGAENTEPERATENA